MAEDGKRCVGRGQKVEKSSYGPFSALQRRVADCQACFERSKGELQIARRVLSAPKARMRGKLAFGGSETTPRLRGGKGR